MKIPVLGDDLVFPAGTGFKIVQWINWKMLLHLKDALEPHVSCHKAYHQGNYVEEGRSQPIAGTH